MLSKKWDNLKSGTDIRGIAVNVMDDGEIDLTDDVAKRVAMGFAFWLTRELKKPYSHISVSVGHDSRLSSVRLKSVLVRQLAASGIKVFDCSLCSTPAMFTTTIDLNCDAAIAVTASHHPFNKNGFKFFTKSGGINRDNLEKILQYAQRGVECQEVLTQNVENVEYIKKYAAKLRDLLCKELGVNEYDQPLYGLKIMVDAGNGAGGFYANDVLLPLGADISKSRFLEPDGRFPNHVPNPEDETVMQIAAEYTKTYNQDLGIVFDTDVDRVGAVDSYGNIINKNRLIALAAFMVMQENRGATIVTDSVTSDNLKEYIEKTLGGVHCRFKRGYKNVIDEAVRLNAEGVNCPLGIETSGHAALRENFFLDDGAYLITKIIVLLVKLKKQGKNFDDALVGFKNAQDSCEWRFKIDHDDYKSYGKKVIKEVERYAKTEDFWHIQTDSHEGVRFSVYQDRDRVGWFMLRQSVHDPVLVMNAESEKKGGTELILERVLPVLKKFQLSKIQ